MNGSLFSVQKLSFAWPEQEPLFTDLDLDIQSDEKVLLRGETGSGKSTLLGLLLGVLKPLAGTVFIDGEVVEKLSADTFRRIWYSRQELRQNIFGLCPRHDLEIWQMAYPELLTPQALASIADPLASRWDEPWSALSAGEVRAFTLLLLPFFGDKFWVLDEPTASLDAARKEGFQRLLAKKDPPGLLVVSHDTALPQGIFDRVLLLENGAIREVQK